MARGSDGNLWFAEQSGNKIGKALVTDDDSQFSQLNGGNTFSGNQNVNGNVTATNFVGSGAGLTGVTAANSLALGGVPASGYARLDTGNVLNGNQTVNGSLSATSFAGDGSALTNIVAATASTANFALSAGDAMTLGHLPAVNYARLDIGNAFNGNQSITGGYLELDNTNVTATTGVITMGGTAVFHNYGSQNMFVGENAGNFSLTGNYNNAFGYQALTSNTSGYNNTAVGAQALVNNTNGFNNTALGVQSLQSNSGGGYNTALGYALIYNSTGSYNTAVGFQAGVNQNGANANTTGSNNTFLGYSAGPQTPNQLTNATAIGSNAVVNASNALVLGSISGFNGATSNVNVGIGTPTPGYSLDVQGGQINASGGLCIAGVCQTSWPSSGGTITGVTAGTGLTGGGSSGGVTLSLASNACSAGNALTALPFTCAPFAGLGSNSFTGNQSVSGTVGATAFSGDGSALTNVNALTAATANSALTAASATNASNLNNVPAASYARLDQGNSFNGNQLVSGALTTTAGITASNNTDIVYGYFENNNNAGTADALYALHTGLGNALHAVNTQTNSTTALFESTYSGGSTRAMVATDNSPSGIAGVLQNKAGGKILSLQNGSGELASVDGSGIFHFAAGQPFPGTGPGTITGITAGAGLTGGGSSGNVSLNIQAAGVTNAMLANPSLTVAAATGGGLTVANGSPVSLGGTTTVSLTSQACGTGSAVTAHPFTCTAFPTFAANTFTGTQTMPTLTVSGVGSFQQVIATGSSFTPIGGIASGTANGVAGQAVSGFGVSGSSTSNAGVYGTSGSSFGVEGISNAYVGVFGQSVNSTGVDAYSTSGDGLYALTYTTNTQTTAAAGVFNNVQTTNPGNILLGQYQGANEFVVDAHGDVTAKGNVTADTSLTVGTSGTPILEHLSQVFTSFTIPAISLSNCATLAPFTLTGASDGDTVALGIKNALITAAAGYILDYFGWVSGANTITIRVCNPRGPSNPILTGSATNTIRVDVWKH